MIEVQSAEAGGGRSPNKAPRWFAAGLVAVALIALGVRVLNVVVWYPTCDVDIVKSVETQTRYPECPADQFRIWGDSAYGYLQGYLLSEGHGYSDSATWYRTGGTRFVPSAGDPPLYAMVLAALQKVGISSGEVQRLANAVFGAAGVVLLALVARRVAGSRAGLVAGAVGAVYPLLWINDAMLLSESLYVPLIALVLLAAYRLWDRADMASAALLGAAVALAALTRGEALAVFGALVVPLLWGMRWVPLRRRAGLAAVCWAVGALIVLPWIAYNLGRFREPVFMTSQTGAVLSAGACDVAFYGEAAGYYAADCYSEYVRKGYATGHPKLPGCDAEAASFVDAPDPELRKRAAACWPDPDRLDESERDQVTGDLARRYIEDNRSRLPKVMVLRVARMFDLYNPDIGAENERLGQNVLNNWYVEGRGRWQSEAGFVCYWVLLPLAVGGTVVLVRRRVPVSPLLAMPAVITVTAAFAFGVTRYRVPVDAVLVVLAAVLADAALGRWWPAPDRGSVRVRVPRGSAPVEAGEVPRPALELPRGNLATSHGPTPYRERTEHRTARC